MSIISALQTYIKTCDVLTSGALVNVDHIGPVPVEYGISPLPGARIVNHYISGKTLREYPFAFRSALYTTDNLTRLDNAGFGEQFADWLEQQTAAGNLPTLGAGQTATAIEATGWGHLYEQGQSDTGVYMIQCRLEYEQAPVTGAEE